MPRSACDAAAAAKGELLPALRPLTALVQEFSSQGVASAGGMGGTDRLLDAAAAKLERRLSGLHAQRPQSLEWRRPEGADAVDAVVMRPLEELKREFRRKAVAGAGMRSLEELCGEFRRRRRSAAGAEPGNDARHTREELLLVRQGLLHNAGAFTPLGFSTAPVAAAAAPPGLGLPLRPDDAAGAGGAAQAKTTSTSKLLRAPVSEECASTASPSPRPGSPASGSSDREDASAWLRAARR